MIGTSSDQLWITVELGGEDRHTAPCSALLLMLPGAGVLRQRRL